MAEDNTPGSEHDCRVFFHKWLPVVAREHYRLNGNKYSDQVSKSIYTMSTQTRVIPFPYLIEKGAGTPGF